VLASLVHARERCSLAGLLLFSRSGLLFGSANVKLEEQEKDKAKAEAIEIFFTGKKKTESFSHFFFQKAKWIILAQRI
jgi:hypothetical protein